MQWMLTILTRRNHHMLNEKSKSVDSTCVTSMLMLLKCEGLNGSRLESTLVQERRHGLRVSRTGKMIPGDSDLTFRTASGEHAKGGMRLHVEGCDDWGSNLRVRGVQAPVCKPPLSVGEYTTMGGVTVLYGDKGYIFQKGFERCEENQCLDPEGDEGFTTLRLHSCLQREQRVQHLHETERKQN